MSPDSKTVLSYFQFSLSRYLSMMPKYQHTTFGTLDLGGASTQITFVPETPSELHPNYTESILLYGEEYKVYTNSFLCYGMNEVYRVLEAHLVMVRLSSI